ncbi:serine/threonine-protein phosphatase 7 isoform X2 [Brassica rapa]|uniref:serine/threonine-protein phosphatase 7 isoform X2 n=1 Tax=Brassica campestris TaxID=3711 RepID=UPI00142E14FE|nr:serine/threonine-protein phosphatase 7 isoform X2 [Brassica rapa]
MQARTSVLDPPWEGSNLIPGDILWSDPSLTPGLSPNEQRGIGLLWGPDYTEEFLKKYQLKANPYYDFENVIDSDDEMDKSAMDSNEEQAASH